MSGYILSNIVCANNCKIHLPTDALCAICLLLQRLNNRNLSHTKAGFVLRSRGFYFILH